MTINLVTGATGFIGKYLVDELLGEDHRVWIIVRKKSTQKLSEFFPFYEDKYKDRFKVLSGNVTKKNLNFSKENIKILSKHTINLWHLAANLSFSIDEEDIVFNTNIIGTKHVVDFANRFGKKLYFMSTAYVCGNKKYFLEDELEKGQKHRNTYETSKYEAEKVVRNKSNIPFVIIRPSIVSGNAYKGKALGCTFGYYRYTHLFYFLKSRIILALKKGGIISTTLKILGTNYSNHTGTLSIPWFIMPYPTNAPIDLIPVDYLVSAIIDIFKRHDVDNKTFHLTNPQPPQYIFLLKSLNQDLGIVDLKYIGLPKWLFNMIFKALYFFVPSFKKYTRSIQWYLPYITYTNIFDRSSTNRYTSSIFPRMDRVYIRQINEFARREIY